MLENKRDVELMLFIDIMQTMKIVKYIPTPSFVLVMVFAFVGW